MEKNDNENIQSSNCSLVSMYTCEVKGYILFVSVYWDNHSTLHCMGYHFVSGVPQP